MEVSKKNKIKAGALAALIALTMTGCMNELAADENYDVVSYSADEDSNIKNGLTQELKVPGESFTLNTYYNFDTASKREWRITSDKSLSIEVNTINLPKDTEVWIDNVHIDTSIKSKYASMDGILQDSMDDRIHNTLMYGFPISNNTKYYGIFAIEGCDKDFIQGSVYGFNGYTSGTVKQERFTESDYLDKGVYASKFQIVFDLLIKTPKDKDPRAVSVFTDFIVPVSSTIKYEDSKGNKKEVTHKKTKE